MKPGKQIGEYIGFYQHEDKNVLAYKLQNTLIHEHPWYHNNGFIRNIHFPEGSEGLSIDLAQGENANYKIISAIGVEAALSDKSLKIMSANSGSTLVLQVSKTNKLPYVVNIPDFKKLTSPAKDLWTWEFEAEGKLAVNKHGAHVQDQIPVPLHNPYGSPMMLTGVDFFKDGRAAVCTLYGDVWIVSGLNDDLKNVVWKRYATGMEIALGLLIINDKVHVAGRDRITRLHDRNNDGMADYYENFCQNYRSGRTVGLEKDKHNNLYFTANGKTIKISSDGKEVTNLVLGGQRNTNGAGVSLDGVVLSSANEGDWTPASLVFEVEEGDNYSVAKFGEEAPTPMAFVPRGIDNCRFRICMG